MADKITELEKQREEMGAALAEARDELQRSETPDRLRIGNVLKEISEEIEQWDRDVAERAKGEGLHEPHGLTERARQIHLKLMNLRSIDTGSDE